MDLEKHEEARHIIGLMSNLAIDVSVTNDAEMASAAALLRDLKGLQKMAEQAQKSLTQPLEHEKKSIIAWFRQRIVDRLDQGERKLKMAIGAYQQEQERIRREAQRAADELARKEREKLEKRAALAAAKGQEEKAATLAEQAQTVVAPVQMEAPKLTGISTRTVYRFEITDPALVPREYLVVDESRIRKVVQALKSDCQIPGVRVYAEQALAAAS